MKLLLKSGIVVTQDAKLGVLPKGDVLIDGVWRDEWYDTQASGGRFVRPRTTFRSWITPDGAAELVAETDFGGGAEPQIGAAGGFLYEPHGAVIRAGLVAERVGRRFGCAWASACGAARDPGSPLSRR